MNFLFLLVSWIIWLANVNDMKVQTLINLISNKHMKFKIIDLNSNSRVYCIVPNDILDFELWKLYFHDNGYIAILDIYVKGFVY